MDNSLTSLDWRLVQAFVAVAETGSLSAAARLIGTSQPTLGRRVHEAELALGVELFRRHAKGLALTRNGEALLVPAQEMRAAAARLELAAAGHDRELSGPVRLTASMVVSHFVLPPVLVALRRQFPEITLDLVASDNTENLLFREADIAVRMYRPDQLDMIARHVTDLSLGIYAARSYLDLAGRPETVEQILAHDWIGYDRNDIMIRGMRQMGWAVTREFFRLRTDDQAAYWQLLRAGAGIGVMQRVVADAEPGMERLLPDLDLPALPVWLTAHKSLRHVPRIAQTWDALTSALGVIS